MLARMVIRVIISDNSTHRETDIIAETGTETRPAKQYGSDRQREKIIKKIFSLPVCYEDP